VFSSVGFVDAVAIDDLNVQINIAAPNPIAFGLLAEVYIHCKDSYAAMTLDQAATTPIGSGSYKLASWTPGSEVVLEKVQDPGNFQRIIWRIIPEASTRSAELIAGNVDIITNVAPDQLDAVNNSGTATVQSVQGTRRIYVGFNLSEPFAAMPGGDAIQDPAVRRALQYAVDVPTICAQLLNFPCVRATGLVNPPNANPNLEPYPYDPAMAEKLLDEAGWPRGEALPRNARIVAFPGWRDPARLPPSTPAGRPSMTWRRPPGPPKPPSARSPGCPAMPRCPRPESLTAGSGSAQPRIPCG
jgi:peptide/nickel transport system substrate-binding protein